MKIAYIWLIRFMCLYYFVFPTRLYITPWSGKPMNMLSTVHHTNLEGVYYWYIFIKTHPASSSQVSYSEHSDRHTVQVILGYSSSTLGRVEKVHDNSRTEYQWFVK